MLLSDLVQGNVKKIPGTGYECQLCGKTTRDMWGMRRHLEGKHAMSAGYTCKKCNAYCKTLNVLQRHDKTHHEF
jgi:Pyruvate/2-oxoacid:ferredoxin oxidoreductase delta subunit